MTPDRKKNESNRDMKMERMYEQTKQENEKTRQKETCEVCGEPVPEKDYKMKFIQAGGLLSGPFCSSDCYWEFLE